MSYNVLACFKTQYSLGKSILTLEKAGSSAKDGPDSIVDIAVEDKLPIVPIVDDSMSGFLEAYTNFRAVKIPLLFGVRITFTQDMLDKSEESLSKNCKFIIFMKSAEGYKRLIKIYTAAATTGFYYEPRIDFKELHKHWNDADLMFCVPFYDSFLFQNSLTFSSCVPDFSVIKPTFFVEKSGLPFDTLLENQVKMYAEDKYPIQKVKSIYYKAKKDFKAYLTFRCIHNRSTLNKPQLEHMTSNEFSYETWKEQNSNG